MEQAVVPNVVGLPATTAEALLRSAGFTMTPSAPWGSDVHVRSQAPPPGVRQASGSSVTVVFGH